MLTDEFESPRAIRERAAAEAKQLVGADDAFFFTFKVIDGINHYTSTCGDVTREMEEKMIPFESRATIVDQVWQPSMVARRERNRFQNIRSILRFLQSTEALVYADFYGPLEITRQCRTRLYDGDRFLGYLGLTRRGPNSPCFSQKEIDALDGYAECLKSKLLCAERLEVRCTQPAYAFFTRDGRKLAYASPGVRSWFTCERLIKLRAKLRLTEQLPDLFVLDARVLRFAELHGDDGPRVMVSIEQAPAPRIDPRADLTPAQRAVADCVLVGATNQEIANRLELSVETVKTHVKNIYERLGVASRLELSQSLTARG